jgi:hypothetical protein
VNGERSRPYGEPAGAEGAELPVQDPSLRSPRPAGCRLEVYLHTSRKSPMYMFEPSVQVIKSGPVAPPACAEVD